jgi:flagellar basal-body rod protein FlgF
LETAEMENTTLVALSRQAALRRKMDVVANNFANMNTTGYKAERMLFVEQLVANRDANGLRGDPLAFVRDVATVRDFSQGHERETGNPLDLAIEGEGFFAVESPTGELYTRNGRFRIDENGQLVNEQGMPVLTSNGGPIYFSATDTDITVSRDGVVSTENGEIGRLRVVRFENPNDLQVIGGLMSSPDRPAEMESVNLVQGMLEGSNVEPIVEMERMIRLHRAYDSARLLIDKEDERIKRMVQVYSG